MKAFVTLVLMGMVPATVLAGAKPILLAVHGGTGYPKSEFPAELEKKIREGLTNALKAGLEKLKNGSGLDAIEAAIRVLEDDSEFNAGKGAVFTREGKNELDASIMEGKTKKAGAVAGVTNVKNPIRAARAVMETTKHVLIAGKGAEQVAKDAGLDIVDPSYFRTDRQWNELQAYLKKKASLAPKRQWGTVGAIAVDKDGNLFAGTSTGGLTGKMTGRMGDSPIIGAGTYADNEGCAVSATGTGEYFIRFHVASDINALVKYKKMAIAAAAKEVIHHKVVPAGGEGGVIVLDRKGNFASAFHSDGLYRGTITSDGTIDIQLY